MYININLSELYEFKPTITAEEINSCKFQRKKNFVNTYQSALDSFVCHHIQPNCMLTIQLHKSEKTTDINVFEERVHFIMKSLEKALLGRHWNRKHYPFIVFFENNHDKTALGGSYTGTPAEQQLKRESSRRPWHAHILCNFTNPETGHILTKEELEVALNTVDNSYRCKYRRKKGPDIHIGMLENQESVSRAVNYCTKELWCQFFHVDNPIRFKLSWKMFGLLKGNVNAQKKQFFSESQKRL